MFVLYETPAGYAIFKVNNRFLSKIYGSTCSGHLEEQMFNFFNFQLLDEKKIKPTAVDNLFLEFETPELANQV